MSVKIRHKERPGLLGSGSEFNVHGLGSVFIAYPDEGLVEEDIADLEVKIGDEWMAMDKAFRTNNLITDNYNTRFFEPPTEEDRDRGYTL